MRLLEIVGSISLAEEGHEALRSQTRPALRSGMLVARRERRTDPILHSDAAGR